MIAYHSLLTLAMLVVPFWDEPTATITVTHGGPVATQQTETEVLVERAVQVPSTSEEAQERISSQIANFGTRQSRYWIGIRTLEAPSFLLKQLRISQGLVVEAVADDSPAARAGLLPDDVIVSVDSTPAISTYALTALIDGMEERPISLSVYREGSEREVIVIPERRKQTAIAVVSLDENGMIREQGSAVRLKEVLNSSELPAMRVLFLQPGLVGTAESHVVIQDLAVATEMPPELSELLPPNSIPFNGRFSAREQAMIDDGFPARGFTNVRGSSFAFSSGYAVSVTDGVVQINDRVVHLFPTANGNVVRLDASQTPMPTRFTVRVISSVPHIQVNSIELDSRLTQKRILNEDPE